VTLCLLHVCVDIAKVFSSSHFIIRAKGSQKPPSRNAHDDSSPYNIIVDKSTDGCSPTLRFSTQQIRLTQMGFCHMYYGPWNLIFSLSGVTAASCVTDTKEGGVKKKSWEIYEQDYVLCVTSIVSKHQTHTHRTVENPNSKLLSVRTVSFVLFVYFCLLWILAIVARLYIHQTDLDCLSCPTPRPRAAL
jgi:hypothetical protein